MNKKYVFFLIAIIIILMLVVGIIISDKNVVELENEVNNIEISVAESVAVKNKTIALQNSAKNIDIVYPEFQNLEDGYERYINSKIYEDLNYEKVYEDASAGLEADQIGLFTYEVTYERYNCGDFVSIVLNQYIHLGDARPRIQKKCYVINAKENTTMTLKDVVSNKTNYKQIIVNEINKQAEDMQIELIGGNGLNTISDKQAFYIKDKELVIYFESSEIAATAVGELEFVMPFEIENNIFIIQ